MMPGQPDGRILEPGARRFEAVRHIRPDPVRPAVDAGGRPVAALRVTGAGGWIGGRLVQLARKRGIDVVQVGRDAWLEERLGPTAAADPASTARAIDPASAANAVDPAGRLDLAGASIVHLAAIAHRPARSVDAVEFERVNRDGTVAFARRARAAGAARFVFVSTAAVMPAGLPRAWTEADPPDPRDPYARAKCEAEQRLWTLHEPGRFDVVVLRPPLVYGPGARANFGRLLALAAGGWPLPLAGADAPRSMVYLDNLVDALLHAASSPLAAGGTFFVADGTERSVAGWIRAVRAGLGQAPRLFGVPMPLVRLAARATGRWPVYERLFLPMRVDGSALRATGWTPPIDPRTALARTLAAWREGGR